mmetsp:Transcript_96658/g.251923  ORF Transcript_96658/g.251923 Transcript_96658/m.251923 type:complete len:217 (+) Transcript_96658:1446-2096(+)
MVSHLRSPTPPPALQARRGAAALPAAGWAAAGRASSAAGRAWARRPPHTLVLSPIAQALQTTRVALAVLHSCPRKRNSLIHLRRRLTTRSHSSLHQHRHISQHRCTDWNQNEGELHHSPHRRELAAPKTSHLSCPQAARSPRPRARTARQRQRPTAAAEGLRALCPAAPPAPSRHSLEAVHSQRHESPAGRPKKQKASLCNREERSRAIVGGICSL